MSHIVVLRQKQAAKLRELLRGKIRSGKLPQPLVPVPGQGSATAITLKELPWQQLAFGEFRGSFCFLAKGDRLRLGDQGRSGYLTHNFFSSILPSISLFNSQKCLKLFWGKLLNSSKFTKTCHSEDV